jgi:ParB-like chromosome segregation protein Spo0J
MTHEQLVIPQTISPDDIEAGDRFRKDYGDINELVASIKEYGLIQPIILAQEQSVEGKAPVFRLVAGGRRLKAIKFLKWKELLHGRDWLLREETFTTDEGKLRLSAIELEENLKRKQMDWPEVIAAKTKLLEIMTKIHGHVTQGGLTREERRTGEIKGFGVRRLAAMLGEAPSTVSQDLRLAEMVKIAPQLKNHQSKTAAQAQSLAVVVAAAIRSKIITQDDAKMAAQKALDYRVLIFCKDEKDQIALLQEFQKRNYKTQAVIV